jgi:hypothetical protein
MGAMTTEPGASRQTASTEGGHVVLCGLGRIGRGILDLLRRLGERVTVITLPSLADARHPAPDEDLRILKGDARDEGLLAQGGLARAKALIAATDDDLAIGQMPLQGERGRLASEQPAITKHAAGSLQPCGCESDSRFILAATRR